LVCEWEDGRIHVNYRGEPIAFREFKQQPKLTELRPAGPRVIVAMKAKKDHPWRQGYQNKKPRIPNQVIATPLVGIALTLRPKKQGSASVRTPTKQAQTTKGGISNKLRMGTFLKSFDNF
jgi:hypothetical protein